MRLFASFSNEQVSFLFSAAVSLYNRAIKAIGDGNPGPTLLAGKALCSILRAEIETRRSSGKWPLSYEQPMDVVQ